MSKVLKLALCLFLFFGCAAPMVTNLTKHSVGYLPPNNPNVGLIYFYRDSEFIASLRGIYIDVNGKRVGALNSGTYFVYEAAPGETVVSVENRLGKDTSRTIQVEAGQSYYVKGGLKMGLWDAVPYINLIAKEEGQGAIHDVVYATMKEKDLKKTVDK